MSAQKRHDEIHFYFAIGFFTQSMSNYTNMCETIDTEDRETYEENSTRQDSKL